jgi:hypothetical protein
MYVAWEDNRSSCGTDYNVQAAAEPYPPSPPQSFPVLPNLGTGNQSDPTIGFFSNELYVAWTGSQRGCTGICFAQGKNPANTSGANSSTPWSTSPVPLLVNDSVFAHRAKPSLFVDSAGTGQNNGNVYVVWQDDRNGSYDIFIAKKKRDGTAFDNLTDPNNQSLHNIKVNGSPNNSDRTNPSMVVERPEPNANGNTPDKIYVAWDDDGQNIITAKSSNGGSTFWTNSGPANLPFNGIPTGPASDPSIAVDTFGRAYLIWTDGRNSPGTDVFFAMGQ